MRDDPVEQSFAHQPADVRSAVFDLFLREAPGVGAAAGAEWPEKLADAVLGYLPRGRVLIG